MLLIRAEMTITAADLPPVAVAVVAVAVVVVVVVIASRGAVHHTTALEITRVLVEAVLPRGRRLITVSSTSHPKAESH
jgi:hypothetical protein